MKNWFSWFNISDDSRPTQFTPDWMTDPAINAFLEKNMVGVGIAVASLFTAALVVWLLIAAGRKTISRKSAFVVSASCLAALLACSIFTIHGGEWFLCFDIVPHGPYDFEEANNSVVGMAKLFEPRFVDYVKLVMVAGIVSGYLGLLGEGLSND